MAREKKPDPSVKEAAEKAAADGGGQAAPNEGTAADRAKEAKEAAKKKKPGRGGARANSGPEKGFKQRDMVKMQGGGYMSRDLVIKQHTELILTINNGIIAAALGKHWKLTNESGANISAALVAVMESRGWFVNGFPPELMLGIAMLPWAIGGIGGEVKKYKRKKKAAIARKKKKEEQAVPEGDE